MHMDAHVTRTHKKKPPRCTNIPACPPSRALAAASSMRCFFLAVRRCWRLCSRSSSSSRLRSSRSSRASSFPDEAVRVIEHERLRLWLRLRPISWRDAALPLWRRGCANTGGRQIVCVWIISDRMRFSKRPIPAGNLDPPHLLALPYIYIYGTSSRDEYLN